MNVLEAQVTIHLIGHSKRQKIICCPTGLQVPRHKELPLIKVKTVSIQLDSKELSVCSSQWHWQEMSLSGNTKISLPHFGISFSTVVWKASSTMLLW